MTLAGFWKEKLIRVKFIGISFASVDRVVNTGDVLELPAEEARAWIAAGLAVETAAPIGPAPTLSEQKTCWRCGTSQAFNYALCVCCGFPI